MKNMKGKDDVNLKMDIIQKLELLPFCYLYRGNCEQNLN